MFLKCSFLVVATYQNIQTGIRSRTSKARNRIFDLGRKKVKWYTLKLVLFAEVFVTSTVRL
jgi:hypothetical protein